VHLGAASPGGVDLITIRLGETLVGIAIGLAAGLLLFPRTGSRRLPSALRTTVDRALAAAAARPGGPADAALRDALVGQHEVATAARAELFAAPGSDALLRRSRQVADLGWALLGAHARQEDALAAWVAARITSDLGPSPAWEPLHPVPGPGPGEEVPLPPTAASGGQPDQPGGELPELAGPDGVPGRGQGQRG
jgi:hypothetical protein